MKTITQDELDTVAGGIPFIALPLVVVALPQPEPSDKPVTEAAD